MANFYLNFQKNKFLFLGMVAIILIAASIAFISPLASPIILIVALIFYLSIKDIKNGILFLTAYLPFEPWLLKFVPEPFYVYVRFASEGLIIFLVLYLIFQYLTGLKKFRYQKTPLDLIIILFLAIGLISIFYNQVELSVGLLSLRQLLRYVLVFYLLVYVGVDKKFIKIFLITSFVVLIVQSVIGLSQLILPDSFSHFLAAPSSEVSFGNVSLETGSVGWNITQRIAGTFGRYDKFGIFLSFFLVLALGLYEQYKKSYQKSYLIFIFLFGAIALIFTFSRLSWLGFLLGLIWIGWVILRDKRVKLTIIICFGLLLLYILFYLLFIGFNLRTYEETPMALTLPKRILQTFSWYEMQNSYYGYGRIFFWVNTPLKVVKSSPLIGVGPGQYGSGVAAALEQKKVSNQLGLPFGIQDRMGQIDNNWLSLWGEYGTLGLILFISLLAVLYKFIKNIYLKIKDELIKGLALGFLGILIAYGCQNLFGPYFEVRTISFYFWTVAGILVSYSYAKMQTTN